MRRATGAVIHGAIAGALVAATIGGAVVAAALPAKPPRSYALLIAGVSGDQPHYQKFWSLMGELYQCLRDRCGYSDDDIILLFEEATASARTVDGVSTKENIEKTFAALADKMQKHDRILIFVIGHANRSRNKVKVNLPGPDLTHREFAALLDKLPTNNQVVVVGTPLSGYAMRHISKPGRICITATDALPELSETVFPYHFVRAFSDRKADADQDGLLSVLEIFNYCKVQVKGFFDEKKLLQTEHALLDDDGDGIGHRDPGGEEPQETKGEGGGTKKGSDGKRAAEVFFELQSGA